MKRITTYFFRTTILLLGFYTTCLTYGQSGASIQNIDFYAEGNKLIIKYDITKAKEGETFEIWYKILTASGKEIIPSKNATTGDFGPGVSGGPNKRIEWDVQADNVDLSEEFHVEVLARSDHSSLKTVKPKKEGVGVGTALVLSAILPGLGKTVVHRGGAQWVWGMVAWGCVAGTVVMNNNAYDAYENYKDATTAVDRDDYFEQAEENDLYSKICLGTAATIWVIDLITTGVQAGKVRAQKNKTNLSLNYGYDPFSRKPLLGFKYSF